MELNKNNMKKILWIITFAILLFVGVQNLYIIFRFVSYLFGLAFPFLLGGGIAFILNVPMSSFENKVFSKIGVKNKAFQKLKRPFSLLLTIVSILGVIFLVVFLIVPEIGRTIEIVSNRFPTFLNEVGKKYRDLLEENPSIVEYLYQFTLDWKTISENIINILKNSGGTMLQSTFGFATSIVGGFINFFLGLLFSIYILLQKEKLGCQAKKLIYAYLPEQYADKLLSICSLSHVTFSKFLSGQCIEAVILGIIFYLAMSIFGFPYALMISVLIAFTALIPVFGAFIGCFVGAFLILIVSPLQALWFIILFLIIQQIEGNLIYPHVVGGSIGLPSIWVLVAVSIGGSTMGVAGMLIFIPMSSVLYTLLREAVNQRLAVKKIPPNKYDS
ncbi:MAG: AI-2E family transporter [Clostridiales bacterium]|jgi:predicted PurR-regulated permease PerM|nr:AI-2E family transporter [Clostridiales bacterium]